MIQLRALENKNKPNFKSVHGKNDIRKEINEIETITERM